MSSTQSNNSNQSVASSLGYIPYIYGQYVPGMMCHGGVPVYGSGVDIALYQAMGMVYTPEGRDTPIIWYVEYLDDVLIRVDNEWILIPRDTMLWGSDVGSDTDSEVSFHTADGFTTAGFWRCVAEGLGNMSQEDFNATLDPVEGLASPSHYITPPASIHSEPVSPVVEQPPVIPEVHVASPPLSDYRLPSPHPSMPGLTPIIESPIPIRVAPPSLMQKMGDAANSWMDITTAQMWARDLPGSNLDSIRNSLVVAVNGIYQTCDEVVTLNKEIDANHKADQSVMQDINESVKVMDTWMGSQFQSMKKNIDKVGADVQTCVNESMHINGVIWDLRDKVVGWRQNKDVS